MGILGGNPVGNYPGGHEEQLGLHVGGEAARQEFAGGPGLEELQDTWGRDRERDRGWERPQTPPEEGLVSLSSIQSGLRGISSGSRGVGTLQSPISPELLHPEPAGERPEKGKIYRNIIKVNKTGESIRERGHWEELNPMEVPLAAAPGIPAFHGASLQGLGSPSKSLN